MGMDNTTDTDTAIYALAIDWQDGRTPNYEAHNRWMCTEAQAIRYFRKSMEGYGHRRALIGPDGTIIETANAI